MPDIKITNIAASGIDPDQDAESPVTPDENDTLQKRIAALKQAAGDPVDMQKYDQAEQEAKQLFQDQASRTEWLSLADRVGNALVRIGAANAGLRNNVDTSQINYGPQTDWAGQLEGARKDYTTELERVNRQRSGDLRQQSENFDLAGKAQADMGRERATVASERVRAAGQAASDARQAERLANQNAIEDRREKLRTDAAAAAEEKNLRGLDVRDLEGQEKGAQKQYQARQQLFNQLLTDDDLGAKSREKLEATYGKTAADAGVDLSEIQQKLDAEGTRPRLLGGRSRDEDLAAKRKVLSDSLAESKNMLDAIHQRKQQRLQGSRPAVASGEDTDSPPDTIRVQGPSGDIATMTPENAKKYLGKPGYKQLP